MFPIFGVSLLCPSPKESGALGLALKPLGFMRSPANDESDAGTSPRFRDMYVRDAEA